MPTLCAALSDHLGGTCTVLGANGLSFELLNIAQGLAFQGRKFGDERWERGENTPRNACMLAVYGGIMPTTLTPRKEPTTDSYGTCCAQERSANGNYWWDSCHIDEATPHHHHGGEIHCTNSAEHKNCLNFNLLAPGDVFTSQISTGEVCYSNADDDGTPYRLECHFDEWPLSTPSTLPRLPLPPSPAPPPAASICDSLATTLGGTCSPLHRHHTDGPISFELVNMHEGLSYGGLKFGDENWGAGENSPRNLCLLAAYGGSMPGPRPDWAGTEMRIPTPESYGQCCAKQRATGGQYWFESCSVGDGTSHAKGDWHHTGRVLCTSTAAKKQCINYGDQPFTSSCLYLTLWSHSWSVPSPCSHGSPP